ncbi:putative lipase ROG1 KNAG_0I00710 [Huiozyma naganishii CBS 8797]|uniref:DUF676 domain-containing protein n=1 Tax=Huiozyma naganishii (strain ATCC MYA-139 / BCRC 22969 / CBS 8797 / KCTC 17520 / NBRC 10181 / NCYC 3082 / Yp74L-3) TaxID=1071383 RepID=J7S264_HUIN7|nr:hypothetical protein KNAG_0I00710 [Kazachstania naganishii CBS 8797]CCK71862.1 hypothetical protein KNAG_0I00710 [Kazachstania naganishii CBS 8797]
MSSHSGNDREGSNNVLFHYKSAVKIGEVERFVITYTLLDSDEIPEDLNLDSLWLNVRNMEPLPFRAAYLIGPYMLYFDVRTKHYHHSQHIHASADQPQFEANLQAQQNRAVELSLHRIERKYVWIVDVFSQILFATNTSVSFEITVGRTRESVLGPVVEPPGLVTYSDRMTVDRLNTLDLWKLPAQISHYRGKPKHVVILTHGLHSNLTSDLIYIQEEIYKAQDKYPNEQLVVDGYSGNVCQTEKGVKYLGTQLAEYIINTVYDEKVTKISFVAHSLGGLIQTFAIAYIAVKHPWFFEKVQPVNFIAIASPLLGIVTDNPAYIKGLLSFGVIGKTGLDLGLGVNKDWEKPLLYLLPGEPVRSVLAKFQRRTLYANAINDGIVPLYSASLLFLNYDAVAVSLLEDKNIDRSAESVSVSDNTAFFGGSFISPFTKMLSVWAPQKFPKENPKVPKISFLQSATSLLIPPLPTKEHIMNPDSRKPVIIHDKVYTEADLPQNDIELDKELFNSKNILLETFAVSGAERKKYQKLEEYIAKRWHKGLSWRKVIVALKPDAHNNIIVRRRFANAYGWPVVDHLISQHFNGEEENEISDAPELTCTNYEDCSWISKTEGCSLFDEGPTGMLSTMSDMLESFAKRRFSSQSSMISQTDPADQVLQYEENNSDLL